MLYAVLGLLAAVGVTALIVHARRFDYCKPLYEAQKEERERATAVLDCVFKYFTKRLSIGLLTGEHKVLVDDLEAPESDKELLLYFFARIAPKTVEVYSWNPLVMPKSYVLTPFGHIIGTKKVQRTRYVGARHPVPVTYWATVPAWGATFADLLRYRDNVLARETLPKTRHTNR